jgi:hypothetical protein
LNYFAHRQDVFEPIRQMRLPSAHQRGDRLNEHPPARSRRARAREAAGRSQQRSEVPPELPGHQADLQHRTSDPIPGGATILGSGWPAFEERSFEASRSYYEYLPKGVVKMEYTVRLNNVGDFALPPSRVEAMYAPEMFGKAPNARVKAEPTR